MNKHLVSLFYGLLLINILFLVFMVLYEFEASIDIHLRKGRIKNIEASYAPQVRNKTRSNFQYSSMSLNDDENLRKGNDVVARNLKTNRAEDVSSLFPRDTGSKLAVDDQSSTDRLSLQLKFKSKEKRRKLILLYFYDKTMTDKKMKEENCNMCNCTFSRSPQDYEKADAVLFKHIPETLVRPVNNSNQIWIYFQLESPPNTIRIPEKAVMNWTATYRSDSTIPTPYGKFHFHEGELKREMFKNYAQHKTKLVAWFVSNCRAKNGRSEYVRELQNYIPVDVFGVCGKLKCPSNRERDCSKMLKRDYKFYLAFENSNCRDYITEKFFNALRNGVIPIVMGAHPNDYSKIAPPQSYIHVDQFESAKDLAYYIILLHNNDHLYNSYFRWKSSGNFMETKFMCRLCAMIEVAPQHPTWYENFEDWWRKDVCLPENRTWIW